MKTFRLKKGSHGKQNHFNLVTPRSDVEKPSYKIFIFNVPRTANTQELNQ